MAHRLEATVERRETTTLLTVDGTLLHRDRFLLAAPPQIGSALELTLPAGATLWSAKVGEQPVRPLQRGGRIAIPLGFGDGPRTVVEVVCVQPQAIPHGRSLLAMELPQLALPVLDHRWRLLLPEAPATHVRTGPRVGLRKAPDVPWRFWLEGEPSVSSYRPAAPRRAR